MHLLNKHQNDLHQSIKTIDFTKQCTPLRVQSKHSRKEGFPPAADDFPQRGVFLSCSWKDIESQWISAPRLL